MCRSLCTYTTEADPGEAIALVHVSFPGDGVEESVSVTAFDATIVE